MKKITTLLIIGLIITACSSSKKAYKNLNSGNYDHTISIVLKKLRANKTKKGHQKYIPVLEEAYAKATQRDINTISHLEQDGNPENLEQIYNTYLALRNRQERIKPLLPLYNAETGLDAYFKFNNYSSDIITTKNDLSAYLYNNAASLFKEGDKFDARQAYDDLAYLDKINPNYKNTRNLMQQAHLKGIDYVIVSIKNNTQQLIPKRLSEDLLDIDTYGLNNDFWTVYHNNTINNTYDYGIELELRAINISPEQVREKHIVKQEQVVDGYEYLLDENEDQVRDSLGNKIKIDKLIDVQCELYEFRQFKSTEVAGQVRYVDYKTKQMLQMFPINSEFVFEHIYATYSGDRRALDEPSLKIITLQAVPFPTDEQMVYDAGTDLKENLKAIITQNSFR